MTARHHHYAPQFYLRNFATDSARNKIATVAKNGDYAVWKERSIETIGYERDLYVARRVDGSYSCYEDLINRSIETPVSQTATWAKIARGQTHLLDASDKPVLYALILHLWARTPHVHETVADLTRQAATGEGDVTFGDEERARLAALYRDDDEAAALQALMGASLGWTEAEYANSALWIWRSPIAVRSSTTPVVSAPAPLHPNQRLEPGMVPHCLQCALNPTTIACLVLGAAGEFRNFEIDANVALGINRSYLVHFAKFERVRHLITGRDDLVRDMIWGPYDLVTETGDVITFRRRSSSL